MHIRKNHGELIARSIFLEKLNAALTRDVPAFSELEQEARVDFLVDVLFTAEANGLKTEQGVASYALAAWWLGFGFESRSRYLQVLLKSHFPEFRKVYAMNEWVHATLGEPQNTAMTDERLKQAFYRTAAWGTTPGVKV
jgi:hypothetical protein